MSHPDPLYDPDWGDDRTNEEWESWCDEQANREIFRDQCRSTTENYESFKDTLIFYWREKDWTRAHAALSAVVMTTDSHDLMIEASTLANLSIWRQYETAS